MRLLGVAVLGGIVLLAIVGAEGEQPFGKAGLEDEGDVSAIDKACAATGTGWKNQRETIAELLGTFGAELSFFNANMHEEQERFHRPGDNSER